MHVCVCMLCVCVYVVRVCMCVCVCVYVVHVCACVRMCANQVTYREHTFYEQFVCMCKYNYVYITHFQHFGKQNGYAGEQDPDHAGGYHSNQNQVPVVLVQFNEIKPRDFRGSILIRSSFFV